jgi:hypothetical protein
MPRELSDAANAARQAQTFRLQRMVDIDVGQGSVGHAVIHAGNVAMIRPAAPDFDAFTLYAFMGAMGRPPQASEASSWVSGLTTAYSSSLAALISEARTLIRGLFDSAEYTARARTNSGFVYDLFAAWFDRLPDLDGYESWLTSLDGGSARSAALDSFQASLEYTDRITTLTLPTEYPGDFR